jgi:hypothetical protein
MQAPGRLDFECFAGATFNYKLTYIAGGVPVNLTDVDARMQVRHSYPSPDPVFSLSNGSGIVLGGTAGTIDLRISSSASAALGVTRTTNLLYDLELENGDGEVTRLLEGSFIVYPEVTR